MKTPSVNTFMIASNNITEIMLRRFKKTLPEKFNLWEQMNYTELESIYINYDIEFHMVMMTGSYNNDDTKILLTDMVNILIMMNSKL